MDPLVVEVQDAESVFFNLFACLKGNVSKISRIEREEKELSDRSLVYGEVEFNAMQSIFNEIRKLGHLLKPGGEFWDVGSGSGKAIMAASLLHDFEKCRGVEILEGLYDASLDALNAWNSEVVEELPVGKGKIDLSFIWGDAREITDWKGGDVVFCNCACYTDKLMRDLEEVADGMAIGSIFITVAKALSSNRWESKHENRYEMSWGKAQVIIQIKVE